jgi:hypothetical protein
MAIAAAVTVEASVVTCGFVTVAVFLAVDSITGSDDEVVTVSVGFRRLPITTCFRLTIVLKLTVDNGEWP